MNKAEEAAIIAEEEGAYTAYMQFHEEVLSKIEPDQADIVRKITAHSFEYGYGKGYLKGFDKAKNMGQAIMIDLLAILSLDKDEQESAMTKVLLKRIGEIVDGK